MGKCQVRSSWFDEKDHNGYFIREWARKHSDHELFCSVCVKKFSIVKGFDHVIQHSAGKKHTEACRQVLSPNQLRLQNARPNNVHQEEGSANSNVSQAGSTSGSVLKIYDVKRKATENELLWIMKCISSNFSQSSVQGLDQLFSQMFNNAAENFTLSTTKFRYGFLLSCVMYYNSSYFYLCCK